MGRNKILVSKINLCLKKFWSKNKFKFQKNVRTKKFVGSQKDVWSKKCLVQKMFGPKKMVSLQNILGLKNLGFKKILVRNFFWVGGVLVVLVLVTWVIWTPNPLDTAKSPWAVYVSNFNLLVHPLVKNFGGGSSCCCSCCCCCDRGKTKSTLRPKTEVWTLT